MRVQNNRILHSHFLWLQFRHSPIPASEILLVFSQSLYIERTALSRSQYFGEAGHNQRALLDDHRLLLCSIPHGLYGIIIAGKCVQTLMSS